VIVGIIGAAMGSPFFLVKARLQAQSAATSINAQYHYNGMVRTSDVSTILCFIHCLFFFT